MWKGGITVYWLDCILKTTEECRETRQQFEQVVETMLGRQEAFAGFGRLGEKNHEHWASNGQN